MFSQSKITSILRTGKSIQAEESLKIPSLLMKLDGKPSIVPMIVEEHYDQPADMLVANLMQSQINNGPINKILIVDDNIFNLMVIEQTLITSFPSVECDKAYNGQEALKALRPNPQAYQLILMDCNMPVMDGFEATSKIREKYGNRAPPIVALTAYTTEETKRRCYQAGMIGYLTKPLELARLRDILSNITLQ
jgi:CheY-like chemotaxis protein